jgi:hypothetical protein
MKNAKHFLFGLFLLLAVSGIASAKDWRGIVAFAVNASRR